MRLVGLTLALLWAFASPALAQTQGNAVGDLVSKCGANVPIFGTGSAGTNAPLSCSGTAQSSQGGTGVASPTANDIYKGAGSSPMVPSALTDDGTKVSSSEPVDLTNGALVTEIPNAGTTGTTLNKLAKLTGAPSTVVILTTADTTGVAGVVVGGAGTTGNALVARQGQASCVFDGATTAGDYVQASTSVAGDCTDATATYPTTGQILGRVLSTNGSGGTYAMTLFSPEIRGGSGGGGGTVTSVAIKGAGGLITSGSCTITSAGTCVLYTPGGFLNKFRNGTFDVWQRGTSSLATSTSITTESAYTADGWQVQPSGATVTCSQQAGNGGTTWALACTGQTSNTDTIIFQRIESFVAAPLAGQTVTVQVQYEQNTGVSVTPKFVTCYPASADAWNPGTNKANCTNNSNVAVDLAASSVSACASGTWCTESYTFAVTAFASRGYEIDFDCNTALTAAQSCQITAADIRVTPGVSTGINSTPPPPELHPIATELAFCQRYYENLAFPYQSAFGGQYVTAGIVSSSSAAIFPYITFTVPMRAAPIVTLPPVGLSSGDIQITNGALSNPTTVGSLTVTASTNGFAVSATGWGGLTTNETSFLFINGSTATITAGAEL